MKNYKKKESRPKVAAYSSKVVSSKGSTVTSFVPTSGSLSTPSTVTVSICVGTDLKDISFGDGGSILKNASPLLELKDVHTSSRLTAINSIIVDSNTLQSSVEAALAAAETSGSPFELTFTSAHTDTVVEESAEVLPAPPPSSSAQPTRHTLECSAVVKEVCKLVGSGARILELGIGTEFENIPKYEPGVSVCGVDLEVRSAEEVADGAAMAADARVQLEHVRGSAERLPFADQSFDGAVGIFVLCSVNDVHSALAELSRVLRPGAPYGFLEHVRAPEGSPLLRMQQHFDLAQQKNADNCHLCRSTDVTLKEATEPRADGKPPLFSSLHRMSRFRVTKMWPVAEQASGILLR
jgi:SAM-dependent methyltransferase